MSESLPYNLILMSFLHGQVFVIMKIIVYQGNQSAIRMENNERNSCTWKLEAFKYQVFFVRNRVDKGGVKIEYCPT